MSNPKISIYTLSGPTTGAIRYVGQTKNSLKDRLMQHKSRPPCKRLAEWYKALSAAGVSPVISEIEVVEWEDRYTAERKHIERLVGEGCDLLNRSNHPNRRKEWEEEERRMFAQMKSLMGTQNVTRPKPKDTYMRNTILVLTLILALIAAPARAQDAYTHQPQLRIIQDVSDCDTVQLGHTAQRRIPKIYLPSFLTGRPQTPQCPPDIYGNAIALDGTEYTITPITRDGFSGFDGTSTFDLPLTYDLDATMNYTDALELFAGSPPEDATYTELKYAFALEDDTLAAHAAGLMQEPETPADLRYVHDSNKASTLNEWIQDGKLTEIQLSGSTPLRPQPVISNEAESLHFMCPHTGHIPSYTVKLTSATVTLDNSFGIRRWVTWVQVEHSAEIIALCPFVRIFRYIEGPAFFELMGSLEESLEGETINREIVWRQPIILQPIAGGEIIEGVATFIASPHGQVIIIYIIVLTAAAIFIGPQVYIFILA